MNAPDDATEKVDTNGATTAADPRTVTALPLLPLNEFDPSALRLNQDFAASGGGRKLLVTVPVRKPTRNEWWRVHPDPQWLLPCAAVLNMKEEREFYLLTPQLAPELLGEFATMAIFTAVNRQNVVFLWPCKLPGSDNRSDRWSQTALEAARLGMTKWTRMAADMSLGAYQIYEAPGQLSEPEWPDVTFTKLLEVAFKDRLISDFEHPVLKRLRGEL